MLPIARLRKTMLWNRPFLSSLQVRSAFSMQSPVDLLPSLPLFVGALSNRCQEFGRAVRDYFVIRDRRRQDLRSKLVPSKTLLLRSCRQRLWLASVYGDGPTNAPMRIGQPRPTPHPPAATMPQGSGAPRPHRRRRLMSLFNCSSELVDQTFFRCATGKLVIRQWASMASRGGRGLTLGAGVGASPRLG